jgi:hypothetical protein
VCWGAAERRGRGGVGGATSSAPAEQGEAAALGCCGEMGAQGDAGVSNKGGGRGFWASVPSVDAAAGIAAVMRAQTKRIAQRLGVIRF